MFSALSLPFVSLYTSLSRFLSGVWLQPSKASLGEGTAGNRQTTATTLLAKLEYQTSSSFFGAGGGGWGGREGDILMDILEKVYLGFSYELVLRMAEWVGPGPFYIHTICAFVPLQL